MLQLLQPDQLGHDIYVCNLKLGPYRNFPSLTFTKYVAWKDVDNYVRTYYAYKIIVGQKLKKLDGSSLKWNYTYTYSAFGFKKKSFNEMFPAQ